MEPILPLCPYYTVVWLRYTKVTVIWQSARLSFQHSSVYTGLFRWAWSEWSRQTGSCSLDLTWKSLVSVTAYQIVSCTFLKELYEPQGSHQTKFHGEKQSPQKPLTRLTHCLQFLYQFQKCTVTNKAQANVFSLHAKLQ
jgi:hypothetical protein